MHFDAMPGAAASTFSISLSGGFSDDQTGFLEARAGWQTRADGTIWRKEAGAFTQEDPLSDWVFPRTTFVASDYEIRMNHTSGGPTTGPGTDVWLGMNATLTWEWRCSRFCVEQHQITFDIRHATDGSKNTASSIEDGAPCMATEDNYWVVIEAT